MDCAAGGGHVQVRIGLLLQVVAWLSSGSVAVLQYRPCAAMVQGGAAGGGLVQLWDYGGATGRGRVLLWNCGGAAGGGRVKVWARGAVGHGRAQELQVLCKACKVRSLPAVRYCKI